MELKENEYYYGEDSKNSEKIHIFKHGVANIYPSQKHFYLHKGDLTVYEKDRLNNLRFATLKEKQWLDLCLKVGEFVNKPIFNEQLLLQEVEIY